MNREPMTQERLAEIRGRLDARTPGVWNIEREDDDEGSPYALMTATERGGLLLNTVLADGLGEDDAKLLSHAPQDLADLLAEVARLRHFESIVSWQYGDTTDGKTREDMVEKAAEATFLREFLRENEWADEARARVSIAAMRDMGRAWQVRVEDARAALDAALGTGEGA